MRFRLFVIVAMAPLLVLSMNCERSEELATPSLEISAPVQSLAAGAGGSARESGVGRINFINIDKEGRCGGGPRIQSRIVVEPDVGPQLVMQECRDVPPRSLRVEEIGLMPHNLKNAVYGGRTFDRAEAGIAVSTAPSASSVYLCRGREEDGGLKQVQVADLVLRQKDFASPAEKASVILAVYDLKGRYVKTLRKAELNVRQISTGVKNRVKYVSEDEGVHHLTVWIDEHGDQRTARISWVERASPGRQNEPDFRDEGDQRIVQNLTCVTHEGPKTGFAL